MTVYVCTVPAICKEELQVSHVDLPQRNTVALGQRQSNSVHAVIQRPTHTQTNADGGKIMIRFHRTEAKRASTPAKMHMWYEQNADQIKDTLPTTLKTHFMYDYFYQNTTKL